MNAIWASPHALEEYNRMHAECILKVSLFKWFKGHLPKYKIFQQACNWFKLWWEIDHQRYCLLDSNATQKPSAETKRVLSLKDWNGL